MTEDWKQKSNERYWDKQFVRTTIITLTQDRPDYLAEAIASVEAQTDFNWEHLVYDNASQDPRVLDVLRAARKRNPGKFFFCSPGKRGPDNVALYWNILLGFARGRYITILDDDNRKRPDFLAKMVASLDAAGADAVSCGWGYIGEDGQPVPGREDCHWNRLTTMPKLWQSNTIDSNALMFRRDVPIGQFACLTTCEDWHFVIRLVRNCKMVHLEDVLLDYRVHAAARSNRAESLGLYENMNRIRSELFTREEMRAALSGKVA